MLAVAAEVSVQDFGALHALSARSIRGLIARGLPCYRYTGKVTIPREEGARWLERFRSDRVARLVDEVVSEFRPLAEASRRLRAVQK
jgi:hypothetical protein